MPENVLRDLSRPCLSRGSSFILQGLQHTNEGDCDEPFALESETAAEFSCPKMLRTPAVATEFELEGMALKSLALLYFYLGLPTEQSLE